MNSKENDVRKYLQKKFDADSIKRKLQTYTNAATTELFETDRHYEVKVRIKPNSTIAPALFKPDLENPGHYLAHPTTIRAMRTELFMGGEDFIDLEHIIECTSCKKTLDLQFWKFCPYCEASFKMT